MLVSPESDFSLWTTLVKQMLWKMEFLETENKQICSERHTFPTRVSEVEGHNLSLKNMLHEFKEQEILHHPDGALHAETLDLKSEQEEI